MGLQIKIGQLVREVNRELVNKYCKVQARIIIVYTSLIVTYYIRYDRLNARP